MAQDSSADVTERTATTPDQTAPESTEKSAHSPAQSVSRRALLKGTASAAVGLTGLSAISGTAAAESCNYRPQRAPSWFGYVNPMTGATHNVPWGTDQITIFIHGFDTQRASARDYGWEVWRKLHDMGYPGDGISCIWAAGDSWNDWPWAQTNAIDAGYALGNWLADIGSVQNNGIEVNLVCHSLGAKVALHCLSTLQNRGLYINTVHFLGGAVVDYLVGQQYLDAVVYGCNWLHNWHSTHDDVLGTTFRRAEGYSWPVGWRGIASGTVPENWTDHDHAFEITQHCQYMDYNAGVVNDLYYTL